MKYKNIKILGKTFKSISSLKEFVVVVASTTRRVDV